MNILKKKKNRKNKNIEIKRQSNFELMRIISMYMIVLYHLIRHGNVLSSCVGTSAIIINFLEVLMCVHVNSFILVTGYFQCEKKMSFSKFLSLYNQVWFYKAIIPLILIFSGVLSINLVELIKNVSPLYYGEYWYITEFFILFLISPFLNIVINKCDKREHLKIIVLLIIIFSILPTITMQAFFNVDHGHSLAGFILLYFIGAYFRKYPIEESFIFSKLKLNARKIFFLASYFFIAVLITLIDISGNSFLHLGSIMNEFGTMIKSATLDYSNPFIILETVCYFLFFYSISFKSKMVNKIAGATLGVYLIHESNYVYELLQKLFHLNKLTQYNSMIILKIFIYGLLVFLVCIIIELIRKAIFNFIYKRKISAKVRIFFKNYIESLGISINW